MNFYDEVKRLCKLRGMTIEELMQMAGKTYATYFGWRQRGDYPRADDVYDIAKILEVSVEHFFDDDRGVVVNEKIMNIVKNLESLPNKDLEILNNMNQEQLTNLINLAKSLKS